MAAAALVESRRTVVQAIDIAPTSMDTY
eukprot:SAG22_NODE_11262_length_493_cov_0.817259_2_plen_27_part_01